jgi:hypothetical protein
MPFTPQVRAFKGRKVAAQQLMQCESLFRWKWVHYASAVTSYRKTGAKNRFYARIPAVVFQIRRHQFNQQILAQKSIKMAAIPRRRGAVAKKCCAATLINKSL